MLWRYEGLSGGECRASFLVGNGDTVGPRKMLGSVKPPLPSVCMDCGGSDEDAVAILQLRHKNCEDKILCE